MKVGAGVGGSGESEGLELGFWPYLTFSWNLGDHTPAAHLNPPAMSLGSSSGISWRGAGGCWALGAVVQWRDEAPQARPTQQTWL